MKRTLLILIASVALTACKKENSSRPEISSDELATDQRIILKEKHSVVLIPDNNRSLMIGVTLLDGKITVAEIPGNGKSLAVTWNNEESWTTSVMDIGEDITVSIIDEDGDGLPDLRAEQTEGSLIRYRFGTPDWIPLQ
nr:hypothetical protein [Halomonas sp.]